ncbi:MAG: hypothetical protein ACLPTF_10175 [Steroidobacteraceae bacterium]
MSRTYQNVCLTLPGPLLKALDEEAQAQDRPRSYVARKLLERALTGQERLAALEALAAAELEAANVERVPGPNASEVIAAASAEGRAMLAAHEKIAANNGKAP